MCFFRCCFYGCCFFFFHFSSPCYTVFVFVSLSLPLLFFQGVFFFFSHLRLIQPPLFLFSPCCCFPLSVVVPQFSTLYVVLSRMERKAAQWWNEQKLIFSFFFFFTAVLFSCIFLKQRAAKIVSFKVTAHLLFCLLVCLKLHFLQIYTCLFVFLAVLWEARPQELFLTSALP